MIRFIHTADIHFGVENYGKIDQKTGIHTRLLDFARALEYCIDQAIDHKVDFFLFCGDAYKTAQPNPTQQKYLLRLFLKLYQAHIPTIIIIGNHDHPLSFGKAHALDVFSDLPIDGFFVINKPQVINLKTRSGPINILGIPWPTRNTINLNSTEMSQNITVSLSQTVSAYINEYAQLLDQNIPAVLAGHVTVSNGLFSGSEKKAIYGSDPIFLPSQLAIKPFDYVALGHLHRHQNLNSGGYPAIVYPGSLERIDFGERNEEKGFCLVSIEKKGSTSYTFIKTPTRPFIQIETTIPQQNQTEHLIDEINKHPIKDAIIKVLYHVPSGIENHVEIKKVQKACLDAHYVVSIFPMRQQEKREQRAHIDTEIMHGIYSKNDPTKMDKHIETLLREYFSQKADVDQHTINNLISRLHEITKELATQNQ
jgi:DNA repair protein SbcD/Mre11